MRKLVEITDKIQQLMGNLGDRRVEDYNERWREDTISWLMINRDLTRNELIERRHKLEEIMCLLNSAQRKNHRMITSFLVEIEVVNWLLT